MRDSERGFTLIEVMVSLLLASLVIAGAYGIMIVQQRLFKQQTQVQVAQQGVAVAMELLERDIRKAGLGFGFCRYQELSGRINTAAVEVWRRTDSAAQHVYAIHVDDNFNGAGPDSIVLAWASPPGDGAADSQVADQTAGIWTLPSSPGLTLYPNTSPTFYDEPFLYPNPPLYTASCDCGGTGTACTAPDGSAAKPNLLALVYSLPQWPPPTGAPVTCSVVEVTGVSNNCSAAGSAALTLGQSAAAPWNRASGGSNGMTYSGAQIRALNLGPDTDAAPGITQIRWWVQPAATSPCTTPPCLLRDTLKADGTTVLISQVVANGIEDLQVVPACDWGGDGVIGPEGIDDLTKQNDEWFNNVAGDSVYTDCLTYPLVRVSMIARTSSTDSAFPGPGRPALENHSAGSADGYHRRIQSAIVRAPNVSIYVKD